MMKPAFNSIPAIFFCLMLALLMSACATHPLGMSDEEWNRLSAEQKFEARKLDERNRLEREKLRQEERKQREAEQLAQDVARGMILQFSPERPYCMGGDKCPQGSFDELILSLRHLAEVDRVVFFADDRIGSKHDGKVLVYADDEPVDGKIDIQRRGKWHQVLVARPVRNITLKALGDDEVNIYQVKIYGSWVKDENRYLIIK